MLAALIAAVRDAEDGAGLIATLPVAGRTLIERQVRLAAAAGAVRIVVLVERLPGALTAAIDRLRRDGVQIDVARSAGDGADRFHPDERVLVFADGALAPAPLVARLAAADAPVLLTIGETGPAGVFERIDAATRWSGIALVSGDMLRRTVAMLGDWDLHSTLLRQAAGAKARRVDAADGVDTGEAAAIFLVRTKAGARAATAADLTTGGAVTGWPARFLYGPAARLAAGALLDRPIEAAWLRWGAVAATVAAIPLAWRGWPAAALALAIIAAFADTLGDLLATIRLAARRGIDRVAVARATALAAALLGYALHRRDHGWTPTILAFATIGAMAALARERRILAAGQGTAPQRAATPDALVLVMAVAAIADEPVAGMAALAAYAFVSFGDVQHRLARLAGC